MTVLKQRPVALTGSACPKKASELFYVVHPERAQGAVGAFPD